ncbi:hypothetical protein GGS23DRAFT_606883 [Durotheca rogersii]|uniref:uncharacterized protein n=1 Tax=Durotheca rogersii TaxID=419775 RepID=UPI002220282B|nr:uncharacterized protein GGS23DRAFT_606883 [Durotheca rogersii]KAI5860340.1 hypothetical protein GGS23DRAFT_606883 [Durotheca rogersii]
MSVEATAATAPAPETAIEIEVASEPCQPSNNDARNPSNTNKHSGLHSPPESNGAAKDSSDSELSDLDDIEIDLDLSSPLPSGPADHAKQEDVVKEEGDDECAAGGGDDDIGEVVPDHWSGTVPVFKPDIHQFKDFKKFMTKIDCYGMKSGIVKIIPPQEWKDQHPPLDELVKQVRVREPIKQDIMGSNGTYRQVNILHQRSYNIPQWRQLCDQSEHQPPARRGERRAQAPPRPKQASSSTNTESKTRGRLTRSKNKRGTTDSEDRPMTPVSPKPSEEIMESVEQGPGADADETATTPVIGRMGGSRQAKPKTQSTSARRKYARREASAKVDEEAFKDFDYRMDISDYTPERCEELERIYWKTLTYAPPLYGADLPGTLFDEKCDVWNLNKLPNLLDVLGTKVPGVNTAYLYLGMWKATFAWHLEDVDLYSINYLHFGAPKQWYSISQGDARRFEAAMKSIWPTDAKACDQFLRHKAFLISPNHLLQYFNIKVNKCVSYPGEFVVTYPYGYHSGYNLGYNCAEAVNFALDSWLPMGKIAKRCECAQAQDSVWVDVYEIERKLRGEETDFEESVDEEDDEDDPDMGVMTPPSSHGVRFKQPGRKRKHPAVDKKERKAKKIRLHVKSHAEPPCCLCPHDIPGQGVLPTTDGRAAHRICALYGPDTWIETVEGREVVANVEDVSKPRLEQKCLYCRSKRGACFQCSQKRCARSYHATCAAAAGVFVEEADVPIFGEDGTEYKERAFEFSCRFHRTKRDKKLDGPALEECQKIRQAAAALGKGDICQLQYYRGEIFAGVIAENRADEQTFLLDIMPNGDRVEVEWKWLLLPDPADFHLKKASPNAIPMPTSRQAKERINATRRAAEELPRVDAPFVDGFTWAEFNSCVCTNISQTKVDLAKENQLWHYLGRTSTEARAQYTEDPKKPRHNIKSNFLDTVPRPAPPTAQPRKSYGSTFSVQTLSTTPVKSERPYQYKPRDYTTPSYIHSPFTSQQFTPIPSLFVEQQFTPKPPAYSVPQTTQKLHSIPRNGAHCPQHIVPKPVPVDQQNGGCHLIQPTTPKLVPVPPKSGQVSQASTSQLSGQLSQEPMPKTASIPRPTPPQNGHRRHRSSLGGQNGQPLFFGSDRRFRTPSFSYGSGRYDSAAKSPFSHGFTQPPGLGTSPSPQNGQLFQAQARARSNSLASNRSFDMPMTSSAIRPLSSASTQGTTEETQTCPQNTVKQARPSIVQKYAFFQIHHNRDSTKYRTPYAHWGGFTNGYEGSLRAHLMRSPEALFDIRRQSTGVSVGATSGPSATHFMPSSSSGISNKGASNPPLHTGTRDCSHQLAAPPAYAPPHVAPQTTLPISPDSPRGRQVSMENTNSWGLNDGCTGQLHPAIRAQYAAMLQSRKAEAPEDDGRAQEASPHQPPPPTRSNPFTGAVVAPPTSVGRDLMRPVMAPCALPVSTAADRDLPAPAVSTPSAKVPSVPKQTYIPPPRPWEALRKTQPEAQSFPQPSIQVPPPMATTPATMFPTNTQTIANSAIDPGIGSQRHIAGLGLQPSHLRADQSRATTHDSRRAYIQQPPNNTTRRSPGAAIRRPESDSNPHSTVRIVTQLSPLVALPPPAVSAEDLPEVPEGSSELIESIVRNARRASSAFLGATTGAV